MKKLIFLTITSFFIYSCISQDEFVMTEPIVNNVLDTTVTTDTN
ncbi:MAG: hypothetical protein RIR51_1737, partial [Bacteroidota bacterium]